jgi:hypothetical protein
MEESRRSCATRLKNFRAVHRQGKAMGNMGRKSEPPKQPDEKAKKKPPPPARSDDEDYEDGDIATPKRDRSGNDDEPL